MTTTNGDAFLLRIRRATPDDAMRLLAIYAPYVRDTTITFEWDVPCEEAFASRVRDIARTYPYLVLEENGEMIGYAYAHRHKERAAYAWNAELSVYFCAAARGRGLGEILYGALTDLLVMQRVRNAYAVVTTPNARSERFHETMGFVRAGVYHRTGYKLGAWHDVTLYERRLGENVGAPEPFVPISEIEPARIEETLAKWTRVARERASEERA